jgi:hypothetical protein
VLNRKFTANNARTSHNQTIAQYFDNKINNKKQKKISAFIIFGLTINIKAKMQVLKNIF